MFKNYVWNPSICANETNRHLKNHANNLVITFTKL